MKTKKILTIIAVTVLSVAMLSSCVKPVKTLPPTQTPSQTQTQTAEPSPSEEQSPSATIEPSPTQAPTQTPTPSQTQAPTPSPTPSQTQAPTPSPTPSQTQAPTPTPTPSQTQAPTPTPTPSQTQAPTPTPTPSQTQAPTPSPTPTPTPDSFGISEAYPSGIKEITVVFSAAAPSGATVLLNLGTQQVAGTSLSWGTGRLSVKITKSTAFTPGSYSVTVSNITKAFTVEAEKLSEIVISAERIFALNNQDLKVILLNQYDNQLPLTAYTNFTFNASCQAKPSVLLSISKTSAGFILTGAQNLAANDTVRLLIVENSTGTSVTKDITLSASPAIGSFSFGQIEYASGSTSILVNSSGHYITVNAKDQYGQNYTITPSDVGLNKPVILASTDNLIIDATKITVTNGKLYLPSGAVGSKEGTVTLNAVGQSISSSIQINVTSPPVIKTLEIAGTDGNLYINQWVPLNATAKDQNGNIMQMDTLDGSKLMMISTNATTIPNSNIRFNSTTKRIEIKGSSEGTATIHISYNGVSQGSLDISVLATPVPTYIIGVDIPQIYQKGSTVLFNSSVLSIADQYENDIALTASNSVVVTCVGPSGAKFTEGTVTGGGYTMTAPSTAGQYALTLTLKNGSAVISTYDLVLLVVEDEKIVSYQIQSIPTMYGGATDTITDNGYWKPIIVTGKLASGQLVNLAYTGTMPIGIDQITCTNVDGANNFVIEDVSGVKTLKAQNVTGTITTTVKLWKAGQELTSIDVTASGTAPTLTTLKSTSANISKAVSSGTFQIGTYIEAKDQYGNIMALSSLQGSITYMSSKTTVAFINSSGIVSPVGAGTCNITIYFAGYDKTLIIGLTITN